MWQPAGVQVGRNSNATGFGEAASWWRGLVQTGINSLSELIIYASYDWINGNRFMGSCE